MKMVLTTDGDDKAVDGGEAHTQDPRRRNEVGNVVMVDGGWWKICIEQEASAMDKSNFDR